MFEQLNKSRQLMVEETEKLNQLSIEASEAETQYQRMKTIVALELKNAGMPVTLIQTIIKGEERVNPLLLKRDCAKAILDATNKAIDTHKLDCRLIEKQIDREWRG